MGLRMWFLKTYGPPELGCTWSWDRRMVSVCIYMVHWNWIATVYW